MSVSPCKADGRCRECCISGALERGPPLCLAGNSSGSGDGPGAVSVSFIAPQLPVPGVLGTLCRWVDLSHKVFC